MGELRRDSVRRIRSVNKDGITTAVKIMKVGVVETEPGEMIVKDGYNYMLTDRDYSMSWWEQAYTEQRWQLLDVVEVPTSRGARPISKKLRDAMK